MLSLRLRPPRTGDGGFFPEAGSMRADLGLYLGKADAVVNEFLGRRVERPMVCFAAEEDERSSEEVVPSSSTLGRVDNLRELLVIVFTSGDGLLLFRPPTRASGLS